MSVSDEAPVVQKWAIRVTEQNARIIWNDFFPCFTSSYLRELLADDDEYVLMVSHIQSSPYGVVKRSEAVIICLHSFQDKYRHEAAELMSMRPQDLYMLRLEN